MLKIIPAVFAWAALLMFGSTNLSAQTFIVNAPEDQYTANAWLDLRYLNEKEAGENGFIKLSPDGKSFVNGRGEPLRFWPVNGAGAASEMNDAQLKSYARYLAKIGVNLIRFHAIVAPKGANSKIDEVDTAEVRNIWRAVAAFKKEGIYTAISPFWAHHSPIPASWDLGEYNGNVSLWGVMYFNERLKAAYKKWVSYLYTTVNPYTGIALKDEPAVGLIQIKNEDGLLFYTVDAILPNLKNEMGHRFFQWAATRYGSIDQAYNAWDGVTLNGDSKAESKLDLYNIWEATQPQSGGKAKRLTDQVQYYSEQQRNFYSEMRDHYKAMGCKQLINANNWQPAGEKMIDAERWTNSSVDVLAVNRYYDPQHIGENNGWRIDPGHKYVGASVLFNPHLLPINVKQVADKPFFVTESGWNLPHKYQAEGPFLISSYISLTGVDGLFWFSLTGAGIDQTPYYPWFDLGGGRLAMERWNASVPGQVTQFPANALLFRKGYVAQGAPVVQEERTLPSIFNRELPLVLEAKSFDPNHAPPVPGSNPDATAVSPLAFLVGPVEAVYGSAANRSVVAPDLSQHIDVNRKTITSNTGQLRWNYKDGICALDAPKAKGVAGFLKKQPVAELSDLTITSQNEYAVVQVVSMDDKVISESEKILVQVGTVYRPSGWKESPSKVKIDNVEYDGFVIENTGKMPWVGVDADVVLNFKNAKVKSAHQVDINGYHKKELPLTKAASGFNLTIPKDAFYVILNTSEPTVTTANPEGLKVYPNPTKGSIVIEVPAEWELQNTLQIFDHTGRKVYQKQNLTAGKNTITLPKLSAGLYEVVVTHSKTKEKKVHKIMIGG
jgi:hypothetical protein